ncbi:MAG: Gfo/Idh/MocA family oxidoreductase [Planctomycetaceae bacterium]|jgi:predicted dehydrogenase|nr:Gfo/Idh/MocA family oxidoreductase [Planctomycetaceae bacterium]
MIKIGIIGAGRLGSFHADKIVAHADFELVGVMDTLQSAREQLAAKYNVKVFDNPDSLLDNVDAVVIAVPTSLHYELGDLALRRKKHLLIEKPLCNNTACADKLVELSNKNNSILQVGHIEEFNPAWQPARKNILEFANNKPVIINATRTSGYTFRSTDVGTLLDMMIHDIDLVLSIVQHNTVSVSAVGFNIIGGQHEDIADARVQFENGTVANFFSSRVAAAAVREMHITTVSGNIHIDFAQRSLTLQKINNTIKSGKFAPENLNPETISKIQPTFMQEFFVTNKIENESVDALALEIDDFALAIKNGTPPRITGERGLNAVKLAETILKTMQCN